MSWKIDIHKAYDSVCPDFVIWMLEEYKFPKGFIELVQACISSPTFTININGHEAGFFKGTMGLGMGVLWLHIFSS